jgi:hypothetical protein
MSSTGPPIRRQYKDKNHGTMFMWNIYDGEKGISFSFTNKEGDDYLNIYIKQLEDGNFEYTKKHKEEIEKKDSITMDEMMSILKKNEQLSFALDYMNEKSKSSSKSKSKSKDKDTSKSKYKTTKKK